MGLLLPEASFDDLNVDLLDAGVALGAGGRHLVPGDAGARVRVREDVVGGMARGADGRDAQSRPKEPVAMDGHGVVLEDPILRNVPVPGHRCALPVALTTEEGDVDVGGYRRRVIGPFHIVATMTIGTGRGQGVTPGFRLAMEGFPVKLGLGGVAEATVHRRNLFCVGNRNVLVAKGTPHPHLSMNGGGQAFLCDEEPLDLACPLKHDRIPMAHETHIVSLCPQGPARDNKS
jgi:hypothetical protein